MQKEFTKNYCKAHGLRYRISKEGKLSIWSLITRKYTVACLNIYNRTEDEIRNEIEQHIAVFRV